MSTLNQAIQLVLDEQQQRCREFRVELGDPKYAVWQHKPSAAFPYSVTLVWDDAPGRCEDENYPFRATIYRGSEEKDAQDALLTVMERWPLSLLKPEVYSMMCSVFQQEVQMGQRVREVSASSVADAKGVFVTAMFDTSGTAYRLPIGTAPEAYSPQHAAEYAKDLQRIIQRRDLSQAPAGAPFIMSDVESQVFMVLDKKPAAKAGKGFLALKCFDSQTVLTWNYKGNVYSLYQSTPNRTGQLYEVMDTVSRTFNIGIGRDLHTDTEPSLLDIDPGFITQQLGEAKSAYACSAIAFVHRYEEWVSASRAVFEGGTTWVGARQGLLKMLPQDVLTSTDLRHLNFQQLDKELQDRKSVV